MVHALDDAHRRYHEMVEQRSARSKGSNVDLRTVSFDLQRAIQNYVIALLAMIRDEDPVNVKMMQQALRPIDAVREQNLIERARAAAKASGAAVDTTAVEGLDTAAIEELLSEQEAVHSELGITDPADTDIGEDGRAESALAGSELVEA